MQARAFASALRLKRERSDPLALVHVAGHRRVKRDSHAARLVPSKVDFRGCVVVVSPADHGKLGGVDGPFALTEPATGHEAGELDIISDRRARAEDGNEGTRHTISPAAPNG